MLEKLLSQDNMTTSTLRMTESSIPMIDSSHEATLSEFSLDISSSPKCQLTRKRKVCIACFTTLFFLILPLVVIFSFHNEHEKEHNFAIVDGSLHVALTSCGPVQGVARDGAFYFPAIPYAIPPLVNGSVKNNAKNYRWEPGTTPFDLDQCWTDILKLTEKKQVDCLHVKTNTNGTTEVEGSEDCLTIDIYTPHIGYDSPAPVVVVIAVPSLSGGWMDDSWKEQVTPSTKLARDKRTVFVVPRFRLGPLGFLPRLLFNNTDEIVKNSTDFMDNIIKILKTRLNIEKSYNLGLTDLVAALSWIQLNIEHFGGDSSSVTLLGWGAGTSLVTALTTVKPPRGNEYLFTQAWTTGGNFQDVNTSLPYQCGLELWRNSPCNNSSYDLQCILSLPAKELFKSIPENWFSSECNWLEPDGFWFIQSVKNAWSGDHPIRDVPLVVGSPAHSFINYPSSCLANENKVDAIFEKSDNRLDKVRKFHLNNKENEQLTSDFYVKASIVSKEQVICPLWKLASLADHSFTSGVYFYISTYQRPNVCHNNLSVQLADDLVDISAILGHTKSANSMNAQFITNIQGLFYTFIVEGSLPKSLRANQAVYFIGNSLETHSTDSACYI